MKNAKQIQKTALVLAGLLACGAGQARAAVDFAKQIQPIFDKSCKECHGPDKQKGKLRLDGKEAAFKGGKDGAVILPGNAEKSELYRRIILPQNDDDFMPHDADPLTKAQIELIRDWIKEGAVWPDEIAKSAAAAAPAETMAPGPKPSDAEVKAVAELAKNGVTAQEIAMGINWRQANFRAAGAEFKPQVFTLLRDIANLYELNLATVKISDADLANIAGLTQLHVLHLEHTPIHDAALAHLKRLSNLTYLNLFDTAITDAGLQQLQGLTNLKNIYLFETKVTDAGVADLQTALPKLVINRGWDIKALVKNDEGDKAKTDAPKDDKAAEKKK